MKQMRSRFRLLTLLLVCAFFLVFVVCAGNVLRNAGVSLSSLSALPLVGVSASPEAVLPSDTSSAETPADSATPSPDKNGLPETDNTTDSQYNIVGL